MIPGRNFPCDYRGTWGVRNNLGITTLNSSIFPIGDTGIAWQWVFGDSLLKGEGSHHTEGGYFNLDYAPHSMRLLKTGNIKSGTKIPEGDIGYIIRNKGFAVIMRLTNSSAVANPSCESPDIKVNMGEYDTSTFQKIGSHSPPIRFDIKLNSCSTGIKKVTYSLEPTPTAPVRNASQGIIELNKSSTATGFALQIMDSNHQPMELNKTYTFNDYSSTGGNFTIPMAARYLRTLPTGGAGKNDPGVSPGMANTEISFVMSYL